MKQNEQQLDAQRLQQWIYTFPFGEYRQRINEIIEKCKITKHTLHNWRHGSCRIPPLAKDKLEEMAGRKIFAE
ncbi:MAG: hypothetical protein LBF19_00515 [Prevotellaceae bacterium]|jgi:hypothetical protein|nr:hypothetical protein [Prevotellaceae bacterium]